MEFNLSMGVYPVSTPAISRDRSLAFSKVKLNDGLARIIFTLEKNVLSEKDDQLWKRDDYVRWRIIYPRFDLTVYPSKMTEIGTDG